MKFFVTGVGGQLGHDVMNELIGRGHEGVGSDIQESYGGVADRSLRRRSGRDVPFRCGGNLRPGGGEREPRRSRCGLRVLPLSRERFRACRCGSFSFPDRFREIKSPAMKLPLRHSLPQG